MIFYYIILISNRSNHVNELGFNIIPEILRVLVNLEIFKTVFK
jgi:hypothetical protein